MATLEAPRRPVTVSAPAVATQAAMPQTAPVIESVVDEAPAAVQSPAVEAPPEVAAAVTPAPPEVAAVDISGAEALRKRFEEIRSKQMAVGAQATAVVAEAPPQTEEKTAPATVSAPLLETYATVSATATPARSPSLLTPQERRESSTFAELYSIFAATEHLEAAWVNGRVPNDEYERHCQQLIAQFKTLQNALRGRCPDIGAFLEQQGLHCPYARERLLGSGIAATALHRTIDKQDGSNESLSCFKASEGFITLSDALKLNLTAVDEILPLLRDLQVSITGIPNLPPLAGLERVSGWLVTLNNMRASEKLSDDQCRQLAMDVEHAYTALRNWLQDKR